MPEILKAVSINKFFHEPSDFHVLKNISLSIHKGEFVSIVGKSGSGKSTLMYVLATLDTDYTGSIIINNKNVTDLNQNELASFRNKHIGFVFQSHYLLPEFTVLENIMIPALKLNNKKISDIEKDAREKLRQMEMESFAKHLASKLSGGQQQRVAIARAMINDPDIIMADEPTGNLDSENSSIILNIFRSLTIKGNTIIAITHDEDFAGKSDRKIVMVDGAIQA
ncbi:MAG: ABC transporter ATP-binding protein [Bacteroidota bacterium]